MKKQLVGALAFAVCSAGSIHAQANVVTTLHLELRSGAVFNGTVTFSDGYGKMLDTDGNLTGGSYGTLHFGWTWWEGTGQTNPNAYLGNPATYEDILMAGDAPQNWTDFIGISWLHGNPGDFPVLNLNVSQAYWAQESNNSDAIVQGAFGRTGNVPEPGTLALVGLALAVMGGARRRVMV